MRTGQYFSMMSESQFYVVDVGDDVSMECSFHAERYSLFDNPVLWRKQQMDEYTQINILGSINEPFIQTNRYVVTIDAAEPRYQLQLHISGNDSWPVLFTPTTSIQLSSTQLNSRVELK